MENIIEETVVETVTGSVEDTVKEQAEQSVADAVADAASGSGNIAGMVIAGAMTVFAGIGAFATGKWVKNKVKGLAEKHKAKKAEKLEAQAPAQIQMVMPIQTAAEAPKEGEYLTVADVMAQQEHEEEVEKPTPKKKK